MKVAYRLMLLRGERPAPDSFAPRLVPVLALALPMSFAIALLVSGGMAGGQLTRAAASAVATLIALRGWSVGRGRARAVRGWYVVLLTAWTAGELSRFLTGTTGTSTSFGLLSVVSLGLCAAATYYVIARERRRLVEEAALYLDLLAVAFGLGGAVLVIGSGITDGAGIGDIIQIAFFVGMLAATTLLNVTMRMPFRFAGPWEILAGLSLVAVGYIGMLPDDGFGARELFHALVASGALLIGHGSAGWTDEQDQSLAYETLAARLRNRLPLAAALMTAAVSVVLMTRPALVDDVARAGMAVALGLVVVAVVARQTLLLADRERIRGRERRLSDELTVAEAQYRAVVEHVPGVVYVAEAGQNGRWHFVSPKIEELLGYTAEEWTADPLMWMSRIHPADRDRMALAEAEDRTRTDELGRWEYRLLARDGRIVWVIDDEAVISRDADGYPAMVQGILVDITDRKDLEDQLRHQALHDALTGLPNRVLFIDRLSHALVRRATSDPRAAILFVDLDDFKAVNDGLGHAAGDRILRSVTDRLASVVRPQDTVGRLGGDEFAFLLEQTNADDARCVAERVLDALARPFEFDGRAVTLTASIGIATSGRFTPDADPTIEADALLRDADTAMYAAKSIGKGRIQVFNHRMDDIAVRQRDLRLALENALAGEGLVLEYQPIVDLANGTTLGLEALVRWDHPQLGRLAPVDFVPLAEASGLIGRLGDWVLVRACADMADSGVPVSVNVSAHQLGLGELPARVAEVLHRNGLPAGQLQLELTESTLAGAGAGAETELKAIQALGVRIALDDFGSGYSSLEYLGRLPIDVLKIDRSLVERVHLEPQRREVLRAIGHIADRLGLETIVEGVEQEAQRQVLLELGFTRAQGFLFSPSVPSAVARRRLKVRRVS